MSVYKQCVNGFDINFSKQTKIVSTYLPVTGFTFLEEDDDLIKTVD